DAPTYKWFVNRVLVGTGATLVYTPVNGDTITARLFSTATCAQPDSVTTFVRMTVNPTIYPSVGIATPHGDTICVGVATTFTALPVSGGTAPTFQWKVNGVPVWTGTSWTYVPTNGDRVTVVMNSTITCRNSDTVSHTDLITVSPYVYPAVSIAGNDTVCGGYPAVFHAVGTYAGVRPTYNWFVNSFAYSTGPTLSYPATNGDNISLTMASSWPCLLDTFASDSKGPLYVASVVVPSVTITAYPGWIVLPGTNVTFTAHVSDTGSAPTYRWFKNGVLIPGATNLVYVATMINNRDSFILKATNNDICNGLTGYGDMVITLGENVGVHQVAGNNSDIVLAPNPNNGTFSLTADFGATYTDGELNMEVTNTVGQVVLRRSVRLSQGRLKEQIQLSDQLAAGTYFLNLRSDGLLRTIRFIVN
ncbi:MAG: T9SS C-terminal target domain-containing protein, partial [Chitinophagia bacterium]|nr:T9SS C-terminal target domain-containing protein [Chitinophagia bacterium]